MITNQSIKKQTLEILESRLHKLKADKEDMDKQLKALTKRHKDVTKTYKNLEEEVILLRQEVSFYETRSREVQQM
jgi:chaperonin cofactor prefoldin